MWSFRRKDKSQREIIKKSFSNYLDENLIDSILQNHGLIDLRLKYINFILILVRDDSRQSQNIREALNIIQEHHGMIESITSTLVTVYFGVPLEQPNSKELRIGLVKELSERMGPDLAFIHGACECPVGNVGNENRKAYTALIPGYKSKLSKLSTMEFGQILEI